MSDEMTMYVSVIGDGNLTAYERAMKLKNDFAANGIESNVTQDGLCVRSNDAGKIKSICKKYNLENEVECNGTWGMEVGSWGKF